mgnify:CR=1 FL=1
MTKTNKILTTILAVLLLILAVIGGAIAVQSGWIGARGSDSSGSNNINNSNNSDNIAEQFKATRYSGTVDTEDAVPVVLVIRFHEDGKTGELTSPTLKRYSSLTRTGENTYREDIVHGEGEGGTEWAFTPGENDAMDVSYTTPDGATATAQLPQTDPADNAGEIGINPNVAGAEPDGIEFPADGVRALATIELATKDGDNTTETAIFRGSREANVFTVTYPARGCYGVLEHIDNVTKKEVFSVGDCEDGGIWHFTGGDEKAGEADFTSADESTTGKLTYKATEWTDIDGEIGFSRSGPVLDFYREFTAETNKEADAQPAQAKGSCEPGAFDAVVDSWPTPFETIVNFCDGEWASAAAGGTDDVRAFHFVDGVWQYVPHHDLQPISSYPCHHREILRNEGAPEGLIKSTRKCD